MCARVCRAVGVSFRVAAASDIGEKREEQGSDGIKLKAKHDTHTNSYTILFSVPSYPTAMQATIQSAMRSDNERNIRTSESASLIGIRQTSTRSAHEYDPNQLLYLNSFIIVELVLVQPFARWSVCHSF